MIRPKYQLPTNDEPTVELVRRCFGGADRTWSNVEFNKMLGKGGKARTVPINEQIAIAMRKQPDHAPWGRKQPVGTALGCPQSAPCRMTPFRGRTFPLHAVHGKMTKTGNLDRA